MDLEAPADAWYVWLGVSIASVTIAGVVIGLPSGVPPDAHGGANAIDRIAGSPYEASGTLTHDADEVRLVEGETLEMKNEHGLDRASIAFGEAVIVTGDERLENLTRGTPFEVEFDHELSQSEAHAAQTFIDRVQAAYDRTDGEWRGATDRMAIRTLSIDEIPTESLSVQFTDVHDSGIWGYELTVSYDGPEERTVDVAVEGNLQPVDMASGTHSRVETSTTLGPGSDEYVMDVESKVLDKAGIEQETVQAGVHYIDATRIVDIRDGPSLTPVTTTETEALGEAFVLLDGVDDLAGFVEQYDALTLNEEKEAIDVTLVAV